MKTIKTWSELNNQEKLACIRLFPEEAKIDSDYDIRQEAEFYFSLIKPEEMTLQQLKEEARKEYAPFKQFLGKEYKAEQLELIIYSLITKAYEAGKKEILEKVYVRDYAQKTMDNVIQELKEFREPKVIKIDPMELKFNEVKEPIIVKIPYWKKGIQVICPKCGLKVKPNTSDTYDCSNCYTSFVAQLSF